MATKTRKKNTALVFNPARQLSIDGSRSVNPRRNRNKASSKKRNPVIKAESRGKRNPFRRRSNPASTSGLIIAAVMAGVGVSLFDFVAGKIIPASAGALIRTAVKFGGAALFQSNLGAKIPVLGKHKNDIALVLAVAGVIDLMKQFVFPALNSAVAGVGLIPAPPVSSFDTGEDETTGNIFGNAVIPGGNLFS